jgi:hypothetical protein
MTAKTEFKETMQEIYTVHKFEKKKKYTTLKTYIHSSKTLKINTIDSFMEWNHYLQSKVRMAAKSCKKDCRKAGTRRRR